MAYTFDKLQNQIDDPNRKQNIFAQDPQGLGLVGQPGLGQTTVEKSGGSTAITPAAKGATTTSQVQAVSDVPQARGATEQRQAAIEKSAERAPLPPSLQDLGAGLTAQEQELEKEAESYLSPFKQTDYGLDPETVEQATLGDQPAYDKLAGLLAKGTPGTLPEAFEASDYMTPGVQDIQTAGGLEQYLRRQAGPQYTAGEGQYDVALLSRSPDFLEAATGLGAREKALGAKRFDYQQDLPDEAAGILAENLLRGQEGARTELGSVRQRLLDLIDLQRQQAEFERQGLLAPDQFARDAAARARDALAGLDVPDIEGLDLQAAAAGLDPTQYYSVSEDPITRAMVTSADQAAQFNRILSLLGGGGPIAVEGQLPEFTDFDARAYQQALLDAARGIKSEEEKAIETLQDKVLAGATGQDPDSPYAPKSPVDPGVTEDQLTEAILTSSPIGGGPVVDAAGGIPSPEEISTAAAQFDTGIMGGPEHDFSRSPEEIAVSTALDPSAIPGATPGGQKALGDALSEMMGAPPVTAQTDYSRTPEEIAVSTALDPSTIPGATQAGLGALGDMLSQNIEGGGIPPTPPVIETPTNQPGDLDLDITGERMSPDAMGIPISPEPAAPPADIVAPGQFAIETTIPEPEVPVETAPADPTPIRRSRRRRRGRRGADREPVALPPPTDISAIPGISDAGLAALGSMIGRYGGFY